MKFLTKIIQFLILILFIVSQNWLFWLSVQLNELVVCSCLEKGACCCEHSIETLQCHSTQNNGPAGICYFVSQKHKDSESIIILQALKPFLPANHSKKILPEANSLEFDCKLNSYSDVILPCQEKPPRFARV